MNEQPGFKIGWKTFYYWLVFLFLYGLYKVLPVFPFSIICGTNESNFQHYKAAFFSLLILALIEFWVYRRQVTNVSAFWHPRIFTAVIAPWFVFLVWYLSPAIYGAKMPSIALEVLYSNITTVLSGHIIIVFEQAFRKIQFTTYQRNLVYGLFVVSIMYFMVFTYSHLPWADVFVEADWR